jgi:hypothetical protein
LFDDVVAMSCKGRDVDVEREEACTCLFDKLRENGLWVSVSNQEWDIFRGEFGTESFETIEEEVIPSRRTLEVFRDAWINDEHWKPFISPTSNLV